MTNIMDDLGNELFYWPVGQLIEGDATAPLTIKVNTPVALGRLRASTNPLVSVWARVKGVGATYQDVTVTPIDLSVLGAGPTDFEVYAEALSGIAGIEREAVYIIAGSSSSAGWLT